MNGAPEQGVAAGWSFGPVLVLAGILVIGLAQDIPAGGVGNAQDPGPRAFPVGLGICLIAGGCFELLVWGRQRRRAGAVTGPGQAAARSGWGFVSPENREVLVVLGAVLLYVLAVPWFGFALSTTLFAVGVMVWLGSGVRLAVLVSLALAIVVHLLFGVLFRVQLPPGRLGLPF